MEWTVYTVQVYTRLHMEPLGQKVPQLTEVSGHSGDQRDIMLDIDATKNERQAGSRCSTNMDRTEYSLHDEQVE